MKNNKTITESIVEIAKLYDGTVNRPDWKTVKYGKRTGSQRA
jgi:hypothetical protein